MPKPNTNDNANTAAAELEALRAEVARLKASQAAGGRISYKVSEKGAVSVYGLGRWPVTLYASQWDRLLGDADSIRSFIADNRGRLATKDNA